MARSQDLLVARNWKGAAMGELVRAQLAPFADEASSRIAMAGPDLELKPDAVHSLTLALHELATNAAKYGALSVPEGRVAIAWELGGGSATAAPRFRMSWRESNGPPVTPAHPKGLRPRRHLARWWQARCAARSRSTTRKTGCRGPSIRRARA